MKRFIKWITGDWWVVRRCCWPFPEGYATVHRGKSTILDTGLTREHAQAICDELNKGVPQ